MINEPSLFGDDSASPAPSEADAGIAAWQIDLLRKLLTDHGLTTMDERQRAIEAAVGHPVESLRALTHREAMDVADHLGSAKSPSGSSWDTREESTWIDEL